MDLDKFAIFSTWETQEFCLKYANESEMCGLTQIPLKLLKKYIQIIWLHWKKSPIINFIPFIEEIRNWLFHSKNSLTVEQMNTCSIYSENENNFMFFFLKKKKLWSIKTSFKIFEMHSNSVYDCTFLQLSGREGIDSIYMYV